MDALNAMRSSYFGEPSMGVWESDKFRAQSYFDNGAIRLDVERLDGGDGISWDELRAVKNHCGFSDKDAVEFYPAESDVINTGNWRHLYIFDKPLPLIRRAKNGE